MFKLIIYMITSLISISFSRDLYLEDAIRVPVVIGVNISNSFGANESIASLYGEAAFSMFSCSSTEGHLSIFGGYSEYNKFDFGFLNRNSIINKSENGSPSAGLSAKKDVGLNLKYFGAIAQIGKNICFNQGVSRLKRKECPENHSNMGLSLIFLYDSFKANKYISSHLSSKDWTSSVAKDFGIGLFYSFEQPIEILGASVSPEVGVWSQIWNQSKITGNNGIKTLIKEFTKDEITNEINDLYVDKDHTTVTAELFSKKINDSILSAIKDVIGGDGIISKIFIDVLRKSLDSFTFNKDTYFTATVISDIISKINSLVDGIDIDSRTTTEIKREKFLPIISFSIPIFIKFLKDVKLVIKPSILWASRSIKYDSNKSTEGLGGVLIENRISGSIGVGIAYLER